MSKTNTNTRASDQTEDNRPSAMSNDEVSTDLTAAYEDDEIEMEELAEKYAPKITLAFQRGVVAFVETGKLLIEAKENLDHGEWGKLFKGRLPFDQSTAIRLMTIARNPVIANSDNCLNLPGAERTLYDMARLPPPVVEHLIETKQVTPTTTRKKLLELSALKLPPLLDQLNDFITLRAANHGHGVLRRGPGGGARALRQAGDFNTDRGTSSPRRASRVY